MPDQCCPTCRCDPFGEITVARSNDRNQADVVTVKVRDNGIGFTKQVEREGTRFGLIGMRERVQALGGEFAIDSSAGEGVTITVVIPLDSAPGSRGVAAADSKNHSGE